MGYCRLPAITDYWRVGDDITGDHPLCLTRGMSCRKFKFLFHNIYVVHPTPETQVSSDDDGDGDSDGSDPVDDGTTHVSEDDDTDDDDPVPDFVDLTDTEDEDSDSEDEDEDDPDDEFMFEPSFLQFCCKRKPFVMSLSGDVCLYRRDDVTFQRSQC